MATDRRKKGCPNEACERHQKKIMLKVTEEYCPKCGSKLIFVCPKCFREIENLDSKHRVCSLCEAKSQEQKEAVVEKAKKVGKDAAGLVVPVIIGAGGKIVKTLQNDAMKKTVKIVETAVKEHLKI